MITYILQFGITDSSVFDYKDNSRTLLPDARVFLDDHLHKKADHITQVEATSWLDALGQVGDHI